MTRTEPAWVSNVLEYEAGPAVVVLVVVVGGTLVVGAGSVGDVSVVVLDMVVDVVVTVSIVVDVVWGPVVEEVGGGSTSGLGTSAASAAADGDPTRVGVSVTDDRTDPTAAAAMKTASRVAATHAIAIPIPRRMGTSLYRSRRCGLTVG